MAKPALAPPPKGLMDFASLVGTAREERALAHPTPATRSIEKAF